MRTLKSIDIIHSLSHAIQKTHFELGTDTLNSLQEAYESETLPSAREIMRQLLENADIAHKEHIPLCQDCGTAIFFLEYGDEIHIEGDTINSCIEKAMTDAYAKAFLRKSMCHPFTRANTGDNSPAVIHTSIVKGDTLKISYLAKGGGSENMSQCLMLTPSVGWQGIYDAVINCVKSADSNPCPPIVVGIGIGGTFDTAPIMAKKALLKSLQEKNPDPDLAEKESILLKAINTLNIGPQGLGGKTTCLGVKINMDACHIASLPLAINIQCHSIRHTEVNF